MSIRPARADTDHEQPPQPPHQPSFAFPRSARLLDAGDYDRVFAGARRSADRYFTVLARARALADESFSEPFGAARLGLAISKRSVPRAVARNRIKRVIRDSFRHARAELPCVDLVVLCRRAAVDADNATLSAALAAHWRELAR
ncbi:MAG: ribonuclease P protein component [Halochromatium sp.]